MDVSEPVTVKSYSGHEYPERPESFTWQGKEYKVEEIEGAWREPGERRFRLRTAGGRRFELCYEEKEDRWLVTRLERKAR
ncbi:MAG: hypothetical protein HYX92_02630 [Chloroflexi bacterium]|nr:hypothetical protein [Chloroflexota bacterium]